MIVCEDCGQRRKKFRGHRCATCYRAYDAKRKAAARAVDPDVTRAKARAYLADIRENRPEMWERIASTHYRNIMKIYEAKLTKGVCTHGGCSKKIAPGHVHCPFHYELKARYFRARYLDQGHRRKRT